jgi:hypothetical protein
MMMMMMMIIIINIKNMLFRKLICMLQVYDVKNLVT